MISHVTRKKYNSQIVLHAIHGAPPGTRLVDCYEKSFGIHYRTFVRAAKHLDKLGMINLECKSLGRGKGIAYIIAHHVDSKNIQSVARPTTKRNKG